MGFLANTSPWWASLTVGSLFLLGLLGVAYILVLHPDPAGPCARAREGIFRRCDLCNWKLTERPDALWPPWPQHAEDVKRPEQDQRNHQ